MKVVKCAICGAEFETARPNKKYCSLSCKEAATKVNLTKWHENRKGYKAEYMREYRKKFRTKPLEKNLQGDRSGKE